MNDTHLTKTELEIMKYLWSLDHEVTARDIRNYFSYKNWSKQAISTFLKNLYEYGCVKIRKESLTKYYYSAAITEEEYHLMPVQQLIQNMYRGSYFDFVCALYNTKKPWTEEQRKELQRLIDELE